MAEPKDDPFSPHPDWNFRLPKPRGGLLDPSTVPSRRHPQTGLLAGPPPANANTPPAPPQAAPSYGASSEDQDYHGRNRWPVLRMKADREQSILSDMPAIFPLEDDPEAKGKPPIYAVHKLGADAVRRYEPIIAEEARQAGIDPDLIRAIMYMEMSQGWYGYPEDRLTSPRRSCL
ncbi:MAG: hypothetical protein ACOY3L_02435 [Pseudomonadota bacterium]